MFECPYGRVDGQHPSCISNEQRCDNVTDCLGGEDELDHNCPCRLEGAVHLVDGVVPNQGRVEYCRNGRWASVCHSWDTRDAAVVCRQLGYPSEGTWSSSALCIQNKYLCIHSELIHTCTYLH